MPQGLEPRTGPRREALKQLLAQNFPSPIQAAEGFISFHDETLEAGHWFSLNDVGARRAAMLLCQFNPNSETLAQAQGKTNDVTGPGDLVRLLQRFEDLAKSEPQTRSLLQWLHVARQMGVRYHPWIDEYVEAAKLAQTGPQDPRNQPTALGAEVQPDPADEAEQRIEDEQSALRERLNAERAEVEAISATTLSERSAKRQELERIDGELHDLDGVMPSEHPNWAAAQLARIQSGNQPFEPIFSLHVGPDERLFAVSEVPAMTARAEYSERYSGNEAEMTTGQRVDRLTIEGLHRDKLMAAVRSGHVTPYAGGLTHPSPRQWDPSPEAGYELPINELRKFAKLLLMDVRVMPMPIESDPPPETAPAPTPAEPTVEKDTAPQRIKKRLGWAETEAWGYVVEMLRAGRYGTCKELHDVLFKEANSIDSPFAQGVERHRGQLLLRKLNRPLALKTMQSAWGSLRAAAASKA